MGQGGYPLLLASGETANGRDRLIDRQHPHDLVMELSASVSQNVGKKSSCSSTPAFPGSRRSVRPLSCTAGDHRFARGPDPHHWLEFDPHHVRRASPQASWSAGRRSKQAASMAASPTSIAGTSKPVRSTRPRCGCRGIRRATLPCRAAGRTSSIPSSWSPESIRSAGRQARCGRTTSRRNGTLPRRSPGAASPPEGTRTMGRAEGSLKHLNWTVFGRGEMTENRELLDVEEGPAFRVGKASAGAIRDFRIADHVSMGLGGLLPSISSPTPSRRSTAGIIRPAQWPLSG